MEVSYNTIFYYHMNNYSEMALTSQVKIEGFINSHVPVTWYMFHSQFLHYLGKYGLILLIRR